MPFQIRRNGASALAIALALFAAAGSQVRAETVRGGLVLDRVTIVDVRDGRLVRDRAVIIAGDDIVRIVPAGSVKVAGAGRRIDGKGLFVVPGFNDMHAHNLNSDSPETSLPLMLANGITGFRQMAGAPALLAATAAGRPLLPSDSPALLGMPGTIIVGPAFADPAAVRAEIVRQKREGADFIKVVDLPSASFVAAADAAKANGLPFVGHLPMSVDAREAMRHHMAAIEHVGPGIGLLLNCSRDEAAIRAMLAAIPPSAPNFDIAPEKLQRMLANPMLQTPPPGFLMIRRVLATYDEAKCRAFASDVAASETWMVPTLSRLEAMSLGNAPSLRDNPDLRYVPAAARDLWRQVGADFDAKLTAEQRLTLTDLFAAQMRMTKLFDAAGVKMLAGTDFGGQWIAPGFSLHHEFDLLASTGVSPLRILQMATLDPAIFLHREAKAGTVEVGKSADLVLLDADPTASAANLHRIRGVVRAGRYLDRAMLDRIEARAAAALR